MSNLPKTQSQASDLEKLIIGGDLSQLKPEQRIEYYERMCQMIEAEVIQRPYDYLWLPVWDAKTKQESMKLILYANKSCTDHLRKKEKISVSEPSTEVLNGMFIVKVTAQNALGRTDSDMGVVSLKDKYDKPLTGDRLANAMMKGITKAKRRVTLSLSALTILDESEIETIEGARRAAVDLRTGEILDAPKQKVIIKTQDVPNTNASQNISIEPDGSVVNTETGEVVGEHPAVTAIKQVFPGSEPEQTLENADEGALYCYKLPWEYPGFDMKKIRQDIHKIFGKDGYDYNKELYMYIVPRVLDPEGKSGFPFADFECEIDGKTYCVKESQVRTEFFKWLQKNKKAKTTKAETVKKEAPAPQAAPVEDDIPW